MGGHSDAEDGGLLRLGMAKACQGLPGFGCEMMGRNKRFHGQFLLVFTR